MRHGDIELCESKAIVTYIDKTFSGPALVPEDARGAADKTVARTGYLAGASFTLADINLLPVLYYVQRFPEGGEMVQSAKSLSAYFANHSERRS
jgi:glutathione S-transferase